MAIVSNEVKKFFSRREIEVNASAPHPACGHLLPNAEKGSPSRGGEGVMMKYRSHHYFGFAEA